MQCLQHLLGCMLLRGGSSGSCWLHGLLIWVMWFYADVLNLGQAQFLHTWPEYSEMHACLHLVLLLLKSTDETLWWVSKRVCLAAIMRSLPHHTTPVIDVVLYGHSREKM
jgi:hypothetical protein